MHDFFSAWVCEHDPEHVFTYNEPFMSDVECPTCWRERIGEVPCRRLAVYSKRRGGLTPPGPAVLIDRTTQWGNPFVVGRDGTRAQCIKLFSEWVWADEQLWLRQAARRTLRGHDLLCWCAPNGCHGDIWLVVANGPDE